MEFTLYWAEDDWKCSLQARYLSKNESVLPQLLAGP